MAWARKREKWALGKAPSHQFTKCICILEKKCGIDFILRNVVAMLKREREKEKNKWKKLPEKECNLEVCRLVWSAHFLLYVVVCWWWNNGGGNPLRHYFSTELVTKKIFLEMCTRVDHTMWRRPNRNTLLSDFKEDASILKKIVMRASSSLKLFLQGYALYNRERMWILREPRWLTR